MDQVIDSAGKKHSECYVSQLACPCAWNASFQDLTGGFGHDRFFVTLLEQASAPVHWSGRMHVMQSALVYCWENLRQHLVLAADFD